MAELLRVEQVSKHYDGILALKDASFAVAAGEAHALMGENGAGKSTLAKIIAGSVKADSGRIFLDGQPVSIASPLARGASALASSIRSWICSPGSPKISSSDLCSSNPAASSTSRNWTGFAGLCWSKSGWTAAHAHSSLP